MAPDRKLADVFDKRTTTFLAAAAGIFSLAMIAGLLWYGFRSRPDTWFEKKRLAAEREEAKARLKDSSYIGNYRTKDVSRRERYFKAQLKVTAGAYLLFGSLLIFVLAMRRLSALNASTPVPTRGIRERDEEKERNRVVVSILAISTPVVAACFLGIFLTREKKVAPEAPPAGEIVIVEGKAVDEPVPDRLKWTAFRGPTGQGIAPEMEAPLSWDAAKNENILWKTKLPLPGHSSPIVWGDKLFLTGADLESREVYCFNRMTGKLLWTCKVQTGANLGPDFEPYEDTGLAAPTPVTDGRRVYAFFGTDELAAVDFEGKVVWSTWFGPPDSSYGLSSSPVLHDGKLILQIDQGGRSKPKSCLYALNPEDGKIVWQTPRSVPSSWSSPVVIKTPEREEIVTCADPFVISYDPKTGAELWRAKLLYGDVAPLPVYADGLVYVANTNAVAAAIRPGGSGDVTKTHVVWQFDEGLPDVASPVTDGKFLVMSAADYGAMTCLDAKTGKEVWKQDFDNLFWSSPTLVGRRVYITDWKGNSFVFEMSDTYKQLGTGCVGERVVASPAFVDSKIYMRGKEHLFCIGAKKE